MRLANKFKELGQHLSQCPVCLQLTKPGARCSCGSVIPTEDVQFRNYGVNRKIKVKRV